ncbi:MAG TPA: tRNA (adenosine(37)-N6)-threonylcarbamoyltransferase complex dimerization subunit type 1 TsaB [Candidatus Dormibacteraeota bacterium]|jgi:tRNA threonylcarbamoyladenosine biosynthesis protein TsaB|nr:tRNA (adenosine(37)-N6)-threonylcarbamoyltransferase complex dimerization subunit type 1 TsaB [Candidatus Dormibacteraeota bacterium]
MRLAIDTSGVDQALVVLDGRRLLASDDWVRDRADPPVLVRLDAVVRRAGGTPDDLDAVVAARGPGSFTGLRVGLSLAAGLAYARHIPLYVADSLPILARRASGDPATVALRDAGRREVYAWRDGEAARRLPVDELAGWLPAAARIMVEPAGSLAGWVPGLAHLEVPPAERRPLSAALLDSANWTFDSQKPLRYDEVQALYVQPAAAEERRRKAP